jgi:hypothetical protein
VAWRETEIITSEVGDREEPQMQTKQAAKLREEWTAKGNPDCEHPSLVKEYDLGSDTGDVVCTTCGETWWNADPSRPRRNR